MSDRTSHFFFTSRRRHTKLQGDWSSDVCSSDLVVTTRDDEPMEFISFEDTTAIYETTFFPHAYERFCGMLTTARPYVLKGRVEEEFGAVAMTVEEAAFLDGVPLGGGARRAIPAGPDPSGPRAARSGAGSPPAGGRRARSPARPDRPA